MRIGIFTDTYIPQINGVTTVVSLLFRELQELGHEPLVFARGYPGLDHEVEEGKGIYRFPSFTFPFHRESRVTIPVNRWAYRRLPELEIVHSHTPFSLGLLAMWAARELDIPHIHSYHTLFTEYRYYHYLPRPIRPSRWMAERASAAFCNRCDCVITPTEKIKQELKGYGIERPIFSLPFGVDIREFEKELEWDVRRELNLSADDPLLLHAGRLAKEKNIPFLLRAFRRILAERKAWLVITSGGPERERLERYVAEIGIRDRVIFTGYLDRGDLVGLYEADLFLLASKTETQGIVLVEAMAAGTPVVAIGAMGVLDVVRDGETGILVGEDGEEYAKAVLDLLEDKDRLMVMGAKAKEYAYSTSAQNSAKRLLEIYQRTLC